MPRVIFITGKKILDYLVGDHESDGCVKVVLGNAMKQLVKEFTSGDILPASLFCNADYRVGGGGTSGNYATQRPQENQIYSKVRKGKTGLWCVGTPL